MLGYNAKEEFSLVLVIWDPNANNLVKNRPKSKRETPGSSKWLKSLEFGQRFLLFFDKPAKTRELLKVEYAQKHFKSVFKQFRENTKNF